MSKEAIEMRLVVSNIPDGADIHCVVEYFKNVLSDEIDIQQIPEMG